MTILVTGAGGYIGSIATDLFLKKGHTVIAVDNFCTGYREPLMFLQEKFPGKLTVVERTLHEGITDILTSHTPDAVVHYAAHCLVDESMKDPAKYFHNNVQGTVSLLRSMEEAHVGTLIFSSTCAVYGEAQKVPVDESHPTHPKNPYGESKKMAEKAIEWFGELKGFRYALLRYFNVCGASDDSTIGDSKRPSVLLVQNAVRGALNIEPFNLTCPSVDTPDKTPIRDYINVVDLNEAHLKALEYLIGGGKSGVFNLGTGRGNSVKEIVTSVQKITGTTFPLTPAKTPRQGEYATMYADISKAKSILGWAPQRTIEDSVTTLTKWYNTHPNGWQR